MKPIPKLYGAPWCGLSNGFDTYFKTLGIRFERFNVERDPDAEKAVRAMNDGKLKFPMIVIEDDIMKNPSIPELNKMLNKHNLL